MKCRKKSYHKGEHGRKMCSRPKTKQQANKQTNNSVCNSAMMYVCVTALCLFFGLSQWSGQASGSSRRIPGSRTLEVLLTHGDLIAPLLKTS